MKSHEREKTFHQKGLKKILEDVAVFTCFEDISYFITQSHKLVARIGLWKMYSREFGKRVNGLQTIVTKQQKKMD